MILSRTLTPCLAAMLLLNTGCSVRRFALKKVGDALAGSGATFASDDDLLLVRDAAPFSLKLMESVLAESPRHRGLLLAASRGFTQYAYAFVQQEAEEREAGDLTVAQTMQVRARRLYLRARSYGLRGIETRYAGFSGSLRENPKTALAKMSKADAGLLYWTAAAWGAAISLSKDNPDLVADQPLVEAMMDRALEIDESYNSGAIHSFLISYEPARQGAGGNAEARARKHLKRAMELSGGRLAAPLVAFAETASVSRQNRAEFTEFLEMALAIDAGAKPEWRLENLVMQRRARWLLSRADELFVQGGQ